jgi:hypothetical protein
MSREENEDTSVIRFLARVTATLRRRSPPSVQQRPEPVDEVAAVILAVADRQDDRVALIALDAFQVLDEEPLVPALVEEPGELLSEPGVLAEAVAEPFLDPVPVLDAHRDHAQRLAGPFPGVPQDEIHDRVDFGSRAVGVGTRTPRRRHVGQDTAAVGAGECDQCPVVDVRVRKGNEPFIAASVVPGELPETEHRAERVQDRLEPSGACEQGRRGAGFGFLGVVVGAAGGEERCRGELLVIAGDHELPAAQDRGDRVGGGDLGGLVEDDDIEVGQRGQELADHQGAHRPAGLQREQDVRGVADEVADGQVPPFEAGLVLDQRGLVRELIACSYRVLGVGAADPRRGRLDVAAVAVAEFPDGLVLRLGREASQRQVGQREVVQDRAEPGMPEGPDSEFLRCLAGCHAGQELAEPGGLQRDAESAQLGEPGQGPPVSVKPVQDLPAVPGVQLGQASLS